MTERVDQNIWIKTGKEKESKASPFPKHSSKLQFFIVEKNVLGLELGWSPYTDGWKKLFCDTGNMEIRIPEHVPLIGFHILENTCHLS